MNEKVLGPATSVKKLITTYKKRKKFVRPPTKKSLSLQKLVNSEVGDQCDLASDESTREVQQQ